MASVAPERYTGCGVAVRSCTQKQIADDLIRLAGTISLTLKVHKFGKQTYTQGLELKIIVQLSKF